MLVLILILLCVACVGFAILDMVATQREIQGWPRSVVTYDSSVALSDGESASVRHRFRFTDPAGARHIITEERTIWSELRIGDEVPVAIAPHNQRPVLLIPSLLYRSSIIFAGIGALLLSASVAVVIIAP